MRTSESPQIDTRRVNVAGLCGLVVTLTAASLAFAFDEVRWLALVAVGGGLLAGSLYIGYRRRHGPLDWDQHYGDKNESNFHHL